MSEKIGKLEIDVGLDGADVLLRLRCENADKAKLCFELVEQQMRCAVEERSEELALKFKGEAVSIERLDN